MKPSDMLFLLALVFFVLMTVGLIFGHKKVEIKNECYRAAIVNRDTALMDKCREIPTNQEAK